MITFNVCIEENSRGNVDLTVSRELSNYPIDMQRNYQPMRINNLPRDFIGSTLQKYYELVKEGKQ